MRKKTGLRLVYYIVWLLVIAICGFWLYLNLLDNEVGFNQPQATASIERDTAQQGDVRFIVVGDVKSSVRTFAEQIVPQINSSDADFVVSAGNAVADGSEESYRQAYDVFSKLTIPYVLSFADNEAGAFGAVRYYDKVGPHFFSVKVGQALLVFLDMTGTTHLDAQQQWLEKTFAQSDSDYHLVFSGLPMHSEITTDSDEGRYAREHLSDAVIERYLEIFRRYQVDAVFAANLPVYADFVEAGLRFVTTGGAGGLIVNQEDQYHHFVAVSIGTGGVQIEPVQVDVVSSRLQRTLDSVWSAVLTFVYVSYIRFLIILGLLIALGVKLYQLIFVSRDYYPDFNIDTASYARQRKRILMLSNNYYPFVSGVTVSIERLINGLRRQSHQVAMIAPSYGQRDKDAPGATGSLLRVPTLFAFGGKKEFRYANILSRKARRWADAFKPDLIHVHHPFGLGRLGLWLGKRLQVPVVYTYHTRLEMYAHYVPLPGHLFKNLVSHQLVRRFCNRCDGVIVPTWTVESYLRLIGVKSRILVQPTGIDSQACENLDSQRISEYREAYQLPDDAPILISVSRLGEEKNIHFLLHGLALLNQNRQRKAHLLLVGSGPLQQELESLAGELNISGQVIFCGAVPPADVNLHYALADVFVFASKSETQGMVVLEAMSCGLPVVAVRASGIDDVIIDGETGLKVKERTDTWAAAVQQLLGDDKLYQRFAEASRRLARQHDIEHFAENVNQFYADIMAVRAAGRE